MGNEVDYDDLPQLVDDGPPVDAGPTTIDYASLPMKKSLADEVGMFGQVAEQGARGLFDNAMNIPNAVGDLVGGTLAGATAGVRTLGSGMFDLVTGEPTNMREKLSQNWDKARNTFPMSTLMDGMNAPTSLDAQAALPVMPQAAYQNRTSDDELFGAPGAMVERNEREMTDLGQMFDAERNEILEGVMQRRESQTVGAAAGDVLADVATVISGRAPIVSAVRKSRLAAKAKDPVKLDPGLRRWMDKKAEKVQGWLRDSGMKIAETGAEGAILAGLQDEDPGSAAAFGAGSQMVGNFSQNLWRGIPGNSIAVKTAVGAIGAGSLFQVWKSLTPGGKDYILESQESGYRKMAALVAVGALTSAAGFSRPSTGQLDDLGAIVDSMHTIRRASVMSLFSEIENDDSGDLDRIMTQMTVDPTMFSTTALRRINRAATNEDVSMKDTIESLMESDRKFRRKMISLRGEQESVIDRTAETAEAMGTEMIDRAMNFQGVPQ